MLIYLLIIFFICLIVYQFYPTTKEGLKNYQNYNNENASALSHKNAGNIQVLQERLEKFEGVNKQVEDNTEAIKRLNTQVSNIVKNQQKRAALGVVAKKTSEQK